MQAAAEQAGLDQATTAAIVDDYEKAQLRSLKIGLLTAALLALLALMSTRELPHDPPARRHKQEGPALSPSSMALDARSPEHRRKIKMTAILARCERAWPPKTTMDTGWRQEAE